MTSASDDPISAIRLGLLRQGYEPIPIVGPDAPGPSPGKKPILPGWQSIEITETEVRDWRLGRFRNCTNTGIRTGLLVGVDIDVLNPELSERLQDLARKIFGATPLRRIGRAPKTLFCYRVEEPLAKAETPEFLLPDGSKAQVEILAKGQQFVAYGIHPDTRSEYEWPEAGPDVVPLHDLPLVRGDAVRTYVACAEVLIREAGGRSVKEIEAEEKTAREARRPGPGRASGPPPQGGDFFRNVNAAALRDVDRWVRRLFPAAYWQENTSTPPGAWRIHSKDLGRGLEEDISIHPVEGCQDFGTREAMTCIDLVVEHGGAPDAKAAAFQLCEWLGVAPEAMGWRQGRQGTRQDDGYRQPPRGEEAAAGAAPRGPVWQTPIDFLAEDEQCGVPELRREHVPDALWRFVTDTAARMGVDPSSCAIFAIATCSAVLTDEWEVQPKRFDTTWTEQPRIWVAVVGDPSVLKSPALKACTSPVDRMEARAREMHQDALRKYKVDHKAWKDEGGSPADEPRKPRRVRYLAEGTTVEALSELLREDDEAKFKAPARKLLVRQDELSEWLANLDRYRSGGGGGSGDRGAYLRLFNGGPYNVDRVMRGSFTIPNWSACILGGIQPDMIRRVAKEAHEDGLLQRFLFCVPGETPVGLDRTPDTEGIRRYSDLIEALAALSPSKGAFGNSMSTIVLHEDAHRHREGIDNLRRVMSALPDTSARLKAAYGKWPGLWARLALTFHLIGVADRKARNEDGPPPQILQEETARMASAYLEEVLLPHMLRAHARMYDTPQTGHMKWVAGYILAKAEAIVKAGHRITVRDVTRAYGALRAPEMRRELAEVMDGLVTMAWLLPESPDQPARERTAWLVNPAVLERFAVRGEQERERRMKAQADMADLIRRRKGQAS